MKRSISLLSALAFVLMFSGSAFGQAGSTTVNASAEIITDLTVTKNADLQFGNLSSNGFNGTPTIDPDPSGATKSNTGTNSQQGEVEITAGSGTGLTVYFDNPAELSGGGTPITFTPDYLGSDGSNTTELNEGSTTDVSTGDGNNGTTDTKYFIYLGGELTDGTYDAGSYSGTITVNVDFQ